ncbi:hypothetical protein QP939_51255 [Amycolatopsis nalaikhensis]|uniref:Uncharacterized protein n=1 Tax=Amycolatopsis nalaikhensis TaxID=715472 RepID=A0ABY8XNC2_9PSEU|nr:hypothetical protein [Amycolatopsis sp. 2-2]WIV57042.1 hypothetical protein QP939_51255 [Amycolatopsis sp. 2-2]
MPAAVAVGDVAVGRLVGVGAGLDQPVDLLQQLQERADGGDLARVQRRVRGGHRAAERRERHRLHDQPFQVGDGVDAVGDDAADVAHGGAHRLGLSPVLAGHGSPSAGGLLG